MSINARTILLLLAFLLTLLASLGVAAPRVSLGWLGVSLALLALLLSPALT